MATTLYFHNATSSLANLPTDEQSALAPDTVKADLVTVNRTMTTTAGVSQASKAITTTADTNAHNYYFTRFVSEPLLGITGVTAQTWTYKFAAAESNTAANFPCSSTNKAMRAVCYVWRPGTGKLGNIIDGATAATVDEAGAGAETYHVVTFSGAAVNSTQNGDVIVFEVWFVVTQGTAAAYTDTFYYDGATVGTENASASDAASLISTPQDLTFGYTGINQTYTHKYNIKRLVRGGKPALQFNSTSDYVELGNEATLWSASKTKFSFAIWVNPASLTDSAFYVIINHTFTGAAHTFGMFINTSISRVLVGMEKADTTTIYASAAITGAKIWHHLVCVYDSTLGSDNIKVYVDGVLNAADGGTANLTETFDANVGLFFGTGLGWYFLGALRDFRWYTTKALTQSEIDYIMADSGSAPTPDYWLKMDEGFGSPVDNISGTKTVTLYGGTSWTAFFTHYYKIRQLVAQTFTHKYKIIGRIVQTFTHKYKIRQLINQSFTHKYNIKKLITQTFSHKYNIIGRIAQTFTHKYNIIGRIAKIYTYIYKIRQLSNQSFTHKYNIRQLASQTYTHKYKIRQLITQVFTHNYNIRQLVNQIFTQKYNLRQLVNQTFTHKYNLKQLINQIFSHKYNIRQFVNQTYIQKYNIRQLINQTFSHKYNIRQLVSQTYTHKYNIIQRISQTYTHIYNILEIGLTVVNRTFTHKYDIEQLINQTFNHKYNIRKLITSPSYTHKYNIRQLVSSQAYTHAYKIKQLITQTFTHKYKIVGRIARVYSHIYNIEQRVSQTFTHKYNITWLVSSTPFTFKYKIIGRITRIYTFVYTISKRGRIPFGTPIEAKGANNLRFLHRPLDIQDTNRIIPPEQGNESPVQNAGMEGKKTHKQSVRNKRTGLDLDF